MQKRELAIAYAFGALCLLAGTLWDLPIAQALYRPQTLFALVLEVGWPWVLKLCLAFCAWIVWEKKPLLVAAAQLVLAALFAVDVSDVLHVSLFGWQSLLAFLLLPLLAGCFWRSLSPWRRAWLRPYVIYFLQVTVTTMLIVGLLKIGFGRIRFRQMQDATQFCVWYLPCFAQGTSFPSGHVSSFAAAMLCLLSFRFPTWRCHRPMLLAIVWGSIVCMMVSRIVMGAHFVSDTAAGMLIALGCWQFFDHRWKGWFHDHA